MPTENPVKSIKKQTIDVNNIEIKNSKVEDNNKCFFTERERDCGESLTGPSGVFISPDVDNNGVYESNQDCLWTLTAPEHQVIYLKFIKFDLEFEDNCGYDYVEVCYSWACFQ